MISRTDTCIKLARRLILPALVLSVPLLSLLSGPARCESRMPRIRFETLRWFDLMGKTDGFHSEEKLKYAMSGLEQARKFGKDHPFYSVSLRRISQLAYSLRHLEQAKEYAEAELALIKPLGENYQDLVPVYNMLSKTALAQGRVNEADAYIDKAIAIREKAMNDRSFLSELYIWKSVCAAARGKTSESRRFRKLGRAKFIELTGSQFNARAGVLGDELSDLSLYSKKRVRRDLLEAALYCAEFRLEEARKKHPPSPDDMRATYLTMTGAYQRMGMNKKALESARLCATWTERALGRDNRSYIDAIFIWGTSEFDAGNFDKAIEPLLIVARDAERLKKDHVGLAPTALNMVAHSYMRLNQFDEAEKYMQLAIAMETRPDWQITLKKTLETIRAQKRAAADG